MRLRQHRTVGASIIDLAYGLEKNEDVENFVMLAAWVGRNFGQVTVPGAYLVDFIPTRKLLSSSFM